MFGGGEWGLFCEVLVVERWWNGGWDVTPRICFKKKKKKSKSTLTWVKVGLTIYKRGVGFVFFLQNTRTGQRRKRRKEEEEKEKKKRRKKKKEEKRSSIFSFDLQIKVSNSCLSQPKIE